MRTGEGLCMTDLHARLAQLLGSIETKVEQISQEKPEIPNTDRQTTDEKESNNLVQCEIDPARLKTRQRQIDIGKNSSSYEKFISKYPRYYCTSISYPYLQH